LITPIADAFHPFGWLACKLVAILAAAVLMLASVIGAGMIVVAKLQTAIALLLAPVFIPWAMWQPSMFLFNAWLTFLITGAMTQTMVKIIAALTTSAVDRMSATVASYAHHDVSIVAFGALFACALIIAFMFLSAPRLTAALVGGVSVGLEGWVSVAMGAARAIAAGAKAIAKLGQVKLGSKTGIPASHSNSGGAGRPGSNGPGATAPRPHAPPRSKS
jgi:type IV secretory pathway VirB6-like protein